MQNLIVFCQRCFSWTEPHSDMCPECGADVFLDQPDPDRIALGEVMGTPLQDLGVVRVERKDLPSFGGLNGTTRGLVFLPRLHRRLNGAWEGVTAQRVPGWWPFRADISSPKFLRWLRRPTSSATDDLTKSEPGHEQDPESLVERFMDSPGGIFIDSRQIQGTTTRWRSVRIERSPLRSVTLIDESEDGSLGLRLDAFMSRVFKSEIPSS
jgi:hypothetical protein